EVYRNCRDQIEQGIAAMLKFIDQTSGAPSAAVASDRRTSIAIGADHGGFELKELLRYYLHKKGIAVADFGSHSRESTDYPDYAQAVARSVAEHQHHFGILVCTSGIGMSIAANKVPGARAALVWDEQAAHMAREHNNA